MLVWTLVVVLGNSNFQIVDNIATLPVCQKAYKAMRAQLVEDQYGALPMLHGTCMRIEKADPPININGSEVRVAPQIYNLPAPVIVQRPPVDLTNR